MAGQKRISKRARNRVKIIFIIVGAVAAILLAIVLTIVLTFITLVKHTDKVRDEQKKIVNTYPSEIEKKLEGKYSRTFVVDPKFVLNTSNPIPFADAYAPYEYVVKEDCENGYVFSAWVYPESAKDKQIKEIKDNYYWKTIEKETKKYMEDNMKDFLPKEYKILFLAGFDQIFDNVNLSVPMETYFSTQKNQIFMRLYIVVPPNENMSDKLLTKENVSPILHDFYKRNSGMLWMFFAYYQANSDEDYRNIDVNQFEGSVFMESQEYRKIGIL